MGSITKEVECYGEYEIEQEDVVKYLFNNMNDLEEILIAVVNNEPDEARKVYNSALAMVQKVGLKNIETFTLHAQQKHDLLLKAFDKYDLEYLEERLK